MHILAATLTALGVVVILYPFVDGTGADFIGIVLMAIGAGLFARQADKENSK